jgi:glycosyltransferase involved in cell wall biosynthesis
MSKKKKVVILTAMDPYKDIRAIKIANSLSDNQYDVSLVAGFADKAFKRDAKFSIFDFKIPYNIKSSITKKVLWKLNFFLSSIKTIRRIDPDIIHASNIDMLVLAYFYGFKNRKIIYDSYEICAHKSGVASESRIMSMLIEKVERFLIKRIDYMICVSNSAEKYFREKYSVEKIKNITNVPKVKGLILKKSSNKPKIVLYLGNFSPSRGIEELILAGHLLNPLAGKIHLQGFGAYESDFRKIIIDNNLNEKVQIIPPILPEKVLDEISEKADIGIVLTKPTSINHKLTVSNKIFDYVNAGLPVIMSNVDEHRYLNDKYNIGIIIDEITPEKISDAIERLSRDREFYEELSKNCSIAAKDLNWDKEEQKVLNLYNEIL